MTENSGLPQNTIRLLVFMEAHWPTTGSAKKLIEFERRAASHGNSGVNPNIAIAAVRARIRVLSVPAQTRGLYKYRNLFYKLLIPEGRQSFV
jgi:hypothetical protein